MVVCAPGLAGQRACSKRKALSSLKELVSKHNVARDRGRRLMPGCKDECLLEQFDGRKQPWQVGA